MDQNLRFLELLLPKGPKSFGKSLPPPITTFADIVKAWTTVFGQGFLWKMRLSDWLTQYHAYKCGGSWGSYEFKIVDTGNGRYEVRNFEHIDTLL
jgi:hypothetical protein